MAEIMNYLTDHGVMHSIRTMCFVTVVASIQYRALAENAVDAYYKLSNTRAQKQSYVFDGDYSSASEPTSNKLGLGVDLQIETFLLLLLFSYQSKCSKDGTRCYV